MKNNVSSLYVFFYITIKMRKNRFLVSLSSLPLDFIGLCANLHLYLEIVSEKVSKVNRY